MFLNIPFYTYIKQYIGKCRAVATKYFNNLLIILKIKLESILYNIKNAK